MVEILSILGTLITILAGLAALSSYLRSRDRLRIKSSPVFSRECGVLEVTVANLGHADVTLTSLGFIVLPRPPFATVLRSFLYPLYRQILRRRFRTADRYSALGEADGVPEVVVLGPSQPYTEKIRMDLVAGWLHGGQVAWPYVGDSAGRERYADRPADVYVQEGDAWRQL